MNLQHFNIKLFVDGELVVDLDRIVETFHRWIAAQSMDELLIDVADYRHVPAGPGIVLVGHEADYAMDKAGNRNGLLYNRKAPLDGTDEDRFRQAFDSAVHACRLLEEEFGQLRFKRTEFEVLINDRALAPNTSETHQACLPILETVINRVVGDHELSLRNQDDTRCLFGAVVTLPSPIELAK